MQTLAEYIEEIKGVPMYLNFGIERINWLEHIEKLKTFEEFKNVKKINIIDLPLYLINVETGAPAVSADFLWGHATKPMAVETINLGEDTLNDEIDLYDINITTKIYNPNQDLGYGIWVWPLIYNPDNYMTKKKIEIIFSVEQPQTGIIKTDSSHQTLKKEILDKLSEALDNMEENVPYTRGVTFRGSSRSFKKQQKYERQD